MSSRFLLVHGCPIWKAILNGWLLETDFKGPDCAAMKLNYKPLSSPLPQQSSLVVLPDLAHQIHPLNFLKR